MEREIEHFGVNPYRSLLEKNLAESSGQVFSESMGCGCSACGHGDSMGDVETTGTPNIDLNALANGAKGVATATDDCKRDVVILKTVTSLVVGLVASVVGSPAAGAAVVAALQFVTSVVDVCPALKAKAALSIAECLSGFKDGSADRFLGICPHALKKYTGVLNPYDAVEAYYCSVSPYATAAAEQQSNYLPNLVSGTPDADNRRVLFGQLVMELMSQKWSLEASVMWSLQALRTPQPMTFAQARRPAGGLLPAAADDKTVSARVSQNPFAPFVISVIQSCLRGVAYSTAKSFAPDVAANLPPPPSFLLTGTPASIQATSQAAVSPSHLPRNILIAGAVSLLIGIWKGGR